MSDGDRRLIERIRRGESELYAEIVSRYERPIYCLALRLTGNPEDAWEVSQVAFVSAYRKLDQFDPDRRFFSWLYRIAYNAALDLIAGRRRQVELPVDLVSRVAGPDAEAAASERRALLEAGLAELSFDHRVVIVLRHFLDLSYREMAEILAIEEKTVKSRLFTARRELAARLRKALDR